MAAEPRCSCCDLPVTSCGKQAELRDQTRLRTLYRHLLSLPQWWPASYAGGCGNCGERFDPGTPITTLDPTQGIYRAACCPIVTEASR